MDFDGMTKGEHLALMRCMQSVAEALEVLRYHVRAKDRKTQAALLEYRKQNEALERALTTISVRQRFAAQGGKEAAV